MPTNNPTHRAAPRRGLLLLACTLATLSSASGVVLAQGGGLVAPTPPEVTAVNCVTNCINTTTGVPGSKIRVSGTGLEMTRIVSLPKADGTRAKDKAPVIKANGYVLAVVMPGAVTGTVRLGDRDGRVYENPDIIFTVGTQAELRKAQSSYIFPIRGRHNYGNSGARFGAGRRGHSHQGQDVMAACGTKLVAAHSGTVQTRAYHSAAGNYVVIDGANDSKDFAYMHLRAPARVKKGQRVTTGQQIGKVGDTGSAHGCHLHFEIWTKPGWYEGGHPVDPLKTLKYWDSYS